MLRDWQQTDGVKFDTVLVIDRKLGIETLGLKYLSGDHQDRSTDRLVMRLKLATG